MTRPSVRRVAWLALLAALMHVLLPAAHAMSAGGLTEGRAAGTTIPAAFCLSPGSPLQALLQDDAAPSSTDSEVADGAPGVADRAQGDPGPWVTPTTDPGPSHDTTAALCPLCIAGAMAAVLPLAPELGASTRTLSYVLARRAVDVPAPGVVLLSFLSRGPPAQG